MVNTKLLQMPDFTLKHAGVPESVGFVFSLSTNKTQNYGKKSVGFFWAIFYVFFKK